MTKKKSHSKKSKSRAAGNEEKNLSVVSEKKKSTNKDNLSQKLNPSSAGLSKNQSNSSSKAAKPKSEAWLSLNLFELVSLFWVDLALAGLLLALLGLFYVEVLWILGFVSLGVIFYTLKKGFLTISPLEKPDKLALMGILVLALLLSFSVSPTIFGGRDEGSLATAGILLAQNHSLTHQGELISQMSEIYGPGKALNFPGFYYPQEGALKSQFLPGYSSWLAFWYGTLGVEGFNFANLLPFFTFLGSFYLILRKFLQKYTFAWAGLLLLATSFPIFIFYQFTLTEIFFAALLWLALYSFFRYLRDKKLINFFIFAYPLFLTPFVRIEAVAIVFIFCLMLIIKDSKHLRLASYQFILTALGAFFALAIFTNTSFFVDTFKGFAELPNPTEQSQGSTWGEEGFSLIPDDWRNFYLLKIFYNYNLLPFLLLGGIAIFDLFRKKAYQHLIPFFVFAPSLIYLIDANISLDHPWMLRRFVFAVIPLVFFYSAVILDSASLRLRWLSWSIVVFGVAINIFMLTPFAEFGQNKNLWPQVKRISENFDDNDLVLVAQKSSGSGWSLVSEPLRVIEGIPALYFFNPQDLEKMDLEKFEDVYLLTSSQDEELFSEVPKERVQSYSWENRIINPSRKSLEKPVIEKYQVSGNLYKLSR